jgi:hypothetical protein
MGAILAIDLNLYQYDLLFSMDYYALTYREGDLVFDLPHSRHRVSRREIMYYITMTVLGRDYQAPLVTPSHLDMFFHGAKFHYLSYGNIDNTEDIACTIARITVKY